MKVITVSRNNFSNLCLDLYRNVLSSFSPEILISIATGGDYVAQEIVNKNAIEWRSVKLQRPSTKNKNRHVTTLFTKTMTLVLPYFMLNLFRNAEHYFLLITNKGIRYNDVRAVSIQIDRELLVNKKILIIDDAVDSGATLASVRERIEALTDGLSHVKTAAIVVTSRDSIIKPDFFLYEYCLIRFPWSLDYKSNE